jgi:hypothetical protein
MATTRQSQSEDRSLARDWLDALRYTLGGRRGFLVLGAVVLAGGLALNWSWLVAAGIAPLLLSILPCAAMCALGLCMNRMSGRACASNDAPNPGAAGGDGEVRRAASAAPLSDGRPAEAGRDHQFNG